MFKPMLGMAAEKMSRRFRLSSQELRRPKFAPVYTNQAIGQFGAGMAAPYVSFYAAKIGATSTQLGVLQAVTNLLPNLFQVPWGKLGDRMQRRVPLVLLGSCIASLMYLFMVGNDSAIAIIGLVSVQAFASSIAAPNWSALLGDLAPKESRGSIFGAVTFVAGLTNMLGTIATGVLFFLGEGQGTVELYRWPFIVAGASGIVAALALLWIREPAAQARAERAFFYSVSFTGILKWDREFRYFAAVQMFYNFSMSLIWPILYLTISHPSLLGATNVEIVILTFIGFAATLAFQTQVGRLMDRVGPVSLITLSRFMLISVPVVYALAQNILWIYALEILLGVTGAILNIAFLGFILDNAHEAQRGEYFAIYNALVGISAFAGSIVGGLLGDVFSKWWGLFYGLGAVYLLSTIGRTVGATLFLRVRSRRSYPETLGAVLRADLRRLLSRPHRRR